MMKLELTTKQFRRLLDMAYIGNWILNSTRGDDRFRDYDEVESLLFAKAREEGMPTLAEDWQGEVVPSRAFAEGGIHEAIMEYENNVFFDILAEDLARQTGLVIACGGGLPLHADAIAPLHETGVVFWLCRDPGLTYDSGVLGDRPLAQDGRAAFLDRFAQREPVYRRWAHHIITDPASPEAGLNAILEVLRA